MTILILKSGDLTITTNAWTATDYRGSKVQVHVQINVNGSVRSVNLDMTMNEFRAIVRDGGKMVDIRGFEIEITEKRDIEAENNFHAKVVP